MANKNIKINLDYSQFSSGIADCQRKMGLLTEEFKMQQSALGNNATEVDKLTLAQETLRKKIDLQVQIVEKAQQKFEAMANSEGATAAQVDKAQIAYTKQITKLNELTNELDKVNTKLEETSEAENNMDASSNNASSSSQSLTASITATVAIIASFVSAAQQASQALGEIATKSTEWADDLQTTATQIGVTTTTLQEWAYASELVDVSVETLQGSMSKLTKQMGAAQGGSESAKSAFSSLGVSIQNADGSLRSAEDVFYDVVDALGEIENTAERDSASMAIFGKSAQQLNTLLEAGSEQFRAYGEEAEALGLVMSEDEVEAIASMQDSFDRLDAVMAAASNRVSATIAPAFATIADVISGVNPAVLEFFAGMGMLVGIVAKLTPLLQATAAVTQLVTMSKIASAAATTVETGAEVGLGAAATATNAALLPQIAIAALLIAALAALALAIKSIIDLFAKEADAADKAANSTQKFASASTGSGSSEGTSSSGRKHFALGGRVSGSRVWVGEQGAELVDLPIGSTVYNHQESRNMSSSHNVFNVTIDAKNVDDFNKVVNVFSGLSQSMSRGGRVNG